MNHIPLCFENYLVIEGKLYFTEYYFNCLCTYNLSSCEIERIIYIDSEAEKKNRLFGAMVNYGCWIYLIPFSAKHIYKVNITSEEVTKIILPMEVLQNRNNTDSVKFLSAHILNDKIYIFPAAFQAIVVIDLFCDSVSFIDGWLLEIEGIGRQDENGFFRKTLLNGHNILAPIIKTNKVFIFHDNEEYDVVTIDERDDGFSSICQGENGDYFLLSRKGCTLTRWNKDSGNTTRYFGRWDNSIYAGNIAYYENKVWLFPSTNEKALLFNPTTEEFEIISENKSRNEPLIYNNALFVSDYTNGGLDIYRNGHHTRVEMFFCEELLKKYEIFLGNFYYKVKNRQNCIFFENSEESLMNYIRVIEQND